MPFVIGISDAASLELTPYECTCTNWRIFRNRRPFGRGSHQPGRPVRFGDSGYPVRRHARFDVYVGGGPADRTDLRHGHKPGHGMPAGHLCGRHLRRFLRLYPDQYPGNGGGGSHGSGRLPVGLQGRRRPGHRPDHDGIGYRYHHQHALRGEYFTDHLPFCPAVHLF